MEYKKIYILAEGLDKPEELRKFAFLFREKDSKKIWNYSMKIRENNKGKIQDVAVLEIFLFHCNLRSQGYKPHQIEILHNTPLFIYNDSLYKIERGGCEELDIDNIGMYSLRAGKLNFPFFHILKSIVESKKGSFVRTNNLKNGIIGKGKFYCINDLINHRAESLGDIVIPYNIEGNNVDIFRKKLLELLGDTIVVKKDFSCAGKGVFVIDLKNYTSDQEKKFVQSIPDRGYHSKSSYILPYYDFREEYRFYFTKFEDKIDIYSFKKKEILSSREDIVQAESFQYFKNVKLQWLYVKNEDHKNYKKVFDFAYKNIERLSFDTGTFECGITHSNEIIFFEVNPMSATVCFKGEDENNMNKYYNSLFTNLISQ